MQPRNIICGKECDPYSVSSLLGWYINGPLNHKNNGRVHCHRIQVNNDHVGVRGNGFIFAERKVKEQLTPQSVLQMFNLDFSEREIRIGLSCKGRKF